MQVTSAFLDSSRLVLIAPGSEYKLRIYPFLQSTLHWCLRYYVTVHTYAVTAQTSAMTVHTAAITANIVSITAC